MSAHVTPTPVVGTSGVPRTEAEVAEADEQIKKSKKKDKKRKYLDDEFMHLFGDLVKELNIVEGHERKITKIRGRMQDILKERDA